MFGEESVNLRNFPELYDKYVKQIFNFIYYKTMHKETAEDLTSQTFLKALRNLDQFDSKKGKFSTWLYQIARNQVIDFYRTKKNDVNIEDVWDLAEESDIAGDIDQADELKKVKKNLKDLKPDQREVLILRVWQDLSFKEIAQALDKDEAHCRVIFSRAVQALRKELLPS